MARSATLTAERETGAGPRDGEAALVAAAREGCVSAFETLYRMHSGRVYAVCLRMTADTDEAQDCVQAAFIQAWEKLAGFRGDSAFTTWLHRIAVNEVLGRRRKQARRARHLEVVDDADQELAPDPIRRDAGLGMDLEAAVASLPDGARDVLVLYEIHGFSHQETADQLGVAVGTCKAQLHRAKRLLRQRLGLEEE